MGPDLCLTCTSQEINVMHIQWNLQWEATVMKGWPLARDHVCCHMSLHFYTFVPLMKDHLSYKTTFCGLWDVNSSEVSLYFIQNKYALLSSIISKQVTAVCQLTMGVLWNICMYHHAIIRFDKFILILKYNVQNVNHNTVADTSSFFFSLLTEWCYFEALPQYLCFNFGLLYCIAY